MRTRLVKIGNSRGVRIPKALIVEAGLGDDVELTVRDGTVVIRAASRPRAGWAEAAKLMVERGEGEWIPSAPTAFDREEWKW
jgi:antitoxin MazE